MRSMIRLLGLGAKKKARPQRPRLQLDMSDLIVYAMGDVHGCLDALLALERRIADDAVALPGRKLLVMLGDYVDRGPASAQVLDHLVAPPPPGFHRICLAGNHEVAMLDYLEGRIDLRSWLLMGAGPTLLSYGIDHDRLRQMHGNRRSIDNAVRDAIPAEHVAFLRTLPVLVESRRYVFVHAGIRPGVPMREQDENDLVLIRAPFFDNADRLTRYVVHGHTPVKQAGREGMRVNLDSGAYFSGQLTALRIWRDTGRYLTN